MNKNKNKNILLITRILITVLVAALVSSVVGLIIIFILGNLGMSNEGSLATGNAVIYSIFGLAVGYRLNDLVRQYRKS